jgi:hypothetical protein
MFLLASLSAAIASAQFLFYHPTPLSINTRIDDKLSAEDVPTGKGGFFRDYVVSLKAGDTVTIALSSKSFDTFVSLISSDGITIGENDDGPDGSTNSLLVIRITQSGHYFIRVQTSGATKASGPFTIKVTRQTKNP